MAIKTYKLLQAMRSDCAHIHKSNWQNNEDNRPAIPGKPRTPTKLADMVYEGAITPCFLETTEFRAQDGDSDSLEGYTLA